MAVAGRFEDEHGPTHDEAGDPHAEPHVRHRLQGLAAVDGARVLRIGAADATAVLLDGLVLVLGHDPSRRKDRCARDTETEGREPERAQEGRARFSWGGLGIPDRAGWWSCRRRVFARACVASGGEYERERLGFARLEFDTSSEMVKIAGADAST